MQLRIACKLRFYGHLWPGEVDGKLLLLKGNFNGVSIQNCIKKPLGYPKGFDKAIPIFRYKRRTGGNRGLGHLFQEDLYPFPLLLVLHIDDFALFP